MDNDLSLSVQRALTELVAPLRASAADPQVLQGWLSSLGYPSAITADPALAAIVARVEAIGQAIEGFDATSLKSWEGLAKLLQAASGLTTIFSDLKQFAASHANAAVVGGIADEIITLTVANWLRRSQPRQFRIASALGLIDARETASLDPAVVVNGVTSRYERALDRFRFDTIGDLFARPGTVLKQRYLPNGLTVAPDVVAAEERLFTVLSWLADELGLSWRIEHRPVVPAPPTPDDPTTVVAPDDGPDIPEHQPAGDGSESLPPAAPPVPPEYFASVFRTFVIRLAGNDAGEIAFEVRASSAQHPGGLAGFLLTPVGTFQLTETSGAWTLTASAKGSLPSIAVTASGVDIATGSQAVTGGIAQIQLKRAPDSSSPGPYMAGDPTGTHLELGALDVGAALYFDTARRALAVSFGAAQSAFVIAASDGDGFLSRILPANGMRAVFDAGLELSSDKGLGMRGSAGLDVTIPAGASIAGVQLSSIHLGLNAQSGVLAAEVSATIAASIGPVHAVVDRLGVIATLAFGNGNVGIGNLSLALKPPSGVGLSVDAHGILTGGGFLFHDPVQQLYAGVLQLSLHERLTLTAFGLIATKMPDGSRGYSMIVFITAEGFQPIQLGMGFTLNGIGGMVAIHRTFDEDVLRAGLKNDTLGTLLFPRDPIGNAPTLIATLAAAFPAKQGSYLLGLLVRIGWFTPPLVLLDLALILEFGARTRLLVLGRISALLPSPDNDLVRLILDSMGVIDFDQGTVSIDAVLVDSRLAHKFALTGAMALRARWSSGPGSGFVLAVGGLNSHFAPPEGLPVLQRVGIALSSGDNPRLTCDAYFAITSNTVQFGAHAHLYAAAYGFSVEGDIGYDVLIQIAPLHFVADFNAKVQLKHGSSNLFMVSVDGELEGPRPLRVSGKASFSIFWCDFTVRFDKTLVDGEAPPPPPAIDVLAQLQQALASPQSWTAQRALGHTQGVSLRALPPDSSQLVLDPLGRLLVKQQVVPLNTSRDIEIFAGAPVSGARRFQLAATLNGANQHTDTVQDQFAPAQYFELSDDEKLAAPSFETMDAGLIFGDTAVSFDAGQLVAAPLQYEQIVIDDLAAPPPPDPGPRRPSYTLRADQLFALSNSGAAARAPIRTAGLARFRAADAQAGAVLQAPDWRIVPIADGLPAALDPTVKTWTEHLAALDMLNRRAATWQIVPAHELTD